jgi:hypothetical protein
VPIIFQARYLMATEELYLLDGFLMIIDGSDEEALPRQDRIVANDPMT